LAKFLTNKMMLPVPKIKKRSGKKTKKEIKSTRRESVDCSRQSFCALHSRSSDLHSTAGRGRRRRRRRRGARALTTNHNCDRSKQLENKKNKSKKIFSVTLGFSIVPC
jgi:hypothetical protein